MFDVFFLFLFLEQPFGSFSMPSFTPVEERLLLSLSNKSKSNQRQSNQRKSNKSKPNQRKANKPCTKAFNECIKEDICKMNSEDPLCKWRPKPK